MYVQWASLPEPTPVGQIGGHEGVGHVVKLGPGVSETGKVTLGERVGVKWIANACGDCGEISISFPILTYLCLEPGTMKRAQGLGAHCDSIPKVFFPKSRVAVRNYRSVCCLDANSLTTISTLQTKPGRTLPPANHFGIRPSRHFPAIHYQSRTLCDADS